MHAFVKIAGRQYRIIPNQTFKVDRLDLEPGSSVVINDVMMVSDGTNIEIGRPNLPYAVTLELLSQGRGRKGTTLKFTRRGGHRVKHGWRHHFSLVRVKSIVKGA